MLLVNGDHAASVCSQLLLCGPPGDRVVTRESAKGSGEEVCLPKWRSIRLYLRRSGLSGTRLGIRVQASCWCTLVGFLAISDALRRDAAGSLAGEWCMVNGR